VRKDEEALKDAELERKKQLIDYEIQQKVKASINLPPNDYVLRELINAIEPKTDK
jgi:hypothetical protein